MCNLFLFSCIAPVTFKTLKPISLHLALVFLVVSYAFFGGVVFNHLEGKVHRESKETAWRTKVHCTEMIASLNTWAVYEPWRNQTVKMLVDCFREEPDERDTWSFLTATLYGFGVMTTLGYNRIAPATFAGRMFCIVYGLCGIPVTMIIIANIGSYMHGFAGTARRKVEEYRMRNLMKQTVDDKEPSTEASSVFLVFVFLVYVSFGAILLPALNGQIDFFNGLYYNFICLTALDFGQLVPTRMYLLPITFLYVCLGLAITTIAIEIGSEYMRKLHHLGEKIKNVASTKIRFGGKSLVVRDLLHTVGKKCGIEAKVIDELDLDTMVEQAIAVKEGKLSEEEEESVQNPAPPLSPLHEEIHQLPFYQTTKGSLKNPPTVQKRKIPQPETSRPISPPPIPADEEREKVEIFDGKNAEFVVVRRPMEAVPMTPKLPKGFHAQKELTKKDPKKLYETYQAEWNRRRPPVKKK